MNKFKNALFLLLPVLAIFQACGQDGHVLKGSIANAAKQQATLEIAYFDRKIDAIGTATIDDAGNFQIESKEPFKQGLYDVTIGNKKMFFMLDGSEKTVEVMGDLNTMDKLQVTFKGSETAQCYATFVQGLFSTKFASPDEAKVYINEKGCNPLMKAFFTSQILGRDAGKYVPDFEQAAKDLEAYAPGSKYATDYTDMVAKLKQQVEAQAAAGPAPEASGPVAIGAPAPEIKLPGPDGKVRTLSSLKGKVVLLDFWASWCRPCRNENPHVVEMYKKYKDKGFEVFSVSLDGADPRRVSDPMQAQQMEKDGKQKWMDAIKQDGLLWDNHVSDLKNWGSAPAATYGVTSIPRTFLIGRDGKVVAVNPRQNLEAELLKVL